MREPQRMSVFGGAERATRRDLTSAIEGIVPALQAQGDALVALEAVIDEMSQTVEALRKALAVERSKDVAALQKELTALRKELKAIDEMSKNVTALRKELKATPATPATGQAGKQTSVPGRLLTSVKRLWSRTSA